mmetsp:Transcript_25835/g.50109  ORF Transcript_25835/g.50109 Transcript_25835/m.50109 type:complete len:207 (-) Transcript_25835:1587-2207(-)
MQVSSPELMACTTKGAGTRIEAKSISDQLLLVGSLGSRACVKVLSRPRGDEYHTTFRALDELIRVGERNVSCHSRTFSSPRARRAAFGERCCARASDPTNCHPELAKPRARQLAAYVSVCAWECELRVSVDWRSIRREERVPLKVRSARPFTRDYPAPRSESGTPPGPWVLQSQVVSAISVFRTRKRHGFERRSSPPTSVPAVILA